MTKARIPSAFDTTVSKTERSGVAVLMHWMRQIIENKNLDLGFPDVDTSGADYKSPDIVIYDGRQSQKALCVIEAKPPYHDVFDHENLKKPAWEKANKRKAKYYCTTNFKYLIWFNTQRTNAQESEERQIHEKYHLSEIENLDLLEDARYKNSILNRLEQFLLDLYLVHTNKKPEPLLPIDVFLIFRLQEKIKTLTRYYRVIIRDKVHKDQEFLRDLGKWFIEQNWSFVGQESDFDKSARQAAYLLVNKILFYNLLYAKRPHDLEPLEIPESLYKGKSLEAELQKYFNQVLEIDYESIYTTDFIDHTAFPDNKEVIHEIKELVSLLRRYDFSKLGFDIIGGIFEQLIPAEERHILGQYFTNPDVVDIILRFCLKHEDDKVFDPACGAGTFLVRAYQHKKHMNLRLEHQKILKTLWGCDIAKFPAHLSTINLAINDLAVDENYPQILHEDFFNLQHGSKEHGDESIRKRTLVGMGAKKVVIPYPKIVDCIVGNPPYTRQEEISDISSEESYKQKLLYKALHEGSKKLAEISKRAGIYAYFFVHGTKFLQNSGRFGFVVSNSWLDVDYGKGLQEFFLKHYKIVAIIESKVERWFVDADINTCIVLLEKCTDQQQRNDNLVRFVYLLKPLRYFIPPAQDIWVKEISRFDEIDKLIKTVLSHNEFYKNDELRIYPKMQSDLWDEGLELVEEDGKEIAKYVGSKWGKYLRAPEIFFKILEKIKDKLIPLKKIAKVRRGFTTGANEFFYLTEEEIEQRGLEQKYFEPIIFSLKEVSRYKLKKKKLSQMVLICREEKEKLKGTRLLKYINEGEKKGFHKRPTCASRSPHPWYSLGIGWKKAPLIFPAKVGERMPVFLNDNVFEDKKLYGITPHNFGQVKLLGALMNSTVARLFIEFSCRQLTGAQAIADIDVMVVEKLFIPSIEKFTRNTRAKLEKAFDELCKTEAESLFVEIGAEVASLNLEHIKPERRNLDKLIMTDILGLTQEEQLEVYRAVVDLVKSRLEKSESVKNKKKTKEGIDINALVKIVLEKVGGETLGTFYKENVLNLKSLSTRTLPASAENIRIGQELFDWYLYIGKKHIKCTSELEAQYIKIWAEAGVEKIKVPKEGKDLKRVVPELEKIKAKIDKMVSEYLNSIFDNKTRNKIAHFVWAELVK